MHVHALVLDGCYVQTTSERPTFHPLGNLTALDVAETLQHAQVGITRLIERWHRDDAGWVEDAPVTGVLAAASVENTVALGERRGQRVARLGEPGDLEEVSDGSAVRCHARWDGFDLDASHVVPAGARVRLERLCRLCGAPHNRQYADRGVMRTLGWAVGRHVESAMLSATSEGMTESA